ncbi:deleted in autism protein 1 homolog [Centruroides sculpturatus]|uniref:deleted in autism protein 1 homolog n=1 Tax=Centruroides sculpturatus TaxID=218467 RepID=UPI000C6DE576|nr:deleted in autism protein 1 homolog [Centruroides sculpturatus]
MFLRIIIKKKTIFILCTCVFLYHLSRKIFPIRIDPSEDAFLSVHLCPACYGQNICPIFYHNDFHFVGASKLRISRLFNEKNVYYGQVRNRKVVAKKLAHDSELKETDQHLCNVATGISDCDVREAVIKIVSRSARLPKNRRLSEVVARVGGLTDAVRCPSERFLTYLHDRIIGGKDGPPYEEALAELAYGLSVNPEHLILESFPQSEGWPFSQYWGACGRVVVEEFVGYSLHDYEDGTWDQRLHLAYQLLQIADLLTHNQLGFAMYMTDVNMDNFAVQPDGTLFMIDVENIIFVDLKKLQQDKPPNWNVFHTNWGEGCKDCLSFSEEDLCSRLVSDHNYYAICKGILTPDSYYSPRGFLHDIPPDVDRTTNLSYLLSQCSMPEVEGGRFEVVPKLLQTMQSLL